VFGESDSTLYDLSRKFQVFSPSLFHGGLTLDGALRISTNAQSGHVLTSDQYGNATWQPRPSFNQHWTLNGTDLSWTLSNGRVGIGTSTPHNKLHVKGAIKSSHYTDLNKAIILGNNGSHSFIDVSGTDELHIGYSNPDLEKVVIGQTNLNSVELRVSGNIYAPKVNSGEVEVKLNWWADHVFEDKYSLMSLTEVEKFIKSNGHLPNIPSEEEVMENGIEVGDMQARLLEKIEELTLHMIELEKEIKELKK